jgi:hypothetical protein
MKWRESRKALQEEKALHKATQKDLREAQDLIAVLTQENYELGKQVKDYQERFVKGGVVYTVNNGYLSSAIKLPQYSEYTYDQPIPKEVETTLYQKIPFVKVVNRQLEIDITQYNKYKGALI